MRKFNAADWAEVEHTGKKFLVVQGRVWVRANVPVAVYITQDGIEALAGVGTEIDVLTQDADSYVIDGPKGARVFIHAPHAMVFEPQGEVFTNADRMPLESGSLLAVREEVRRFKLEQREMLRELKREREAMAAVKAAKGDAEFSAPSAPEPAPSGEGDAPSA